MNSTEEQGSSAALCSKSRAQLRYVERQKCIVQSLEKLCKDVCREILDENISISNFVSPLQKLKM
jgi:hypothetical protein